MRISQITKLAIVATLLAPIAAESQASFPTNGIQGPRWRHIGPFRAGRTKSAVGIPTQPNVFYMAVSNGGVWKTTDYGRTWNPIFDDQPTGSIGAVEVAPSNPNIIYVGSGEGLQRPDLSTGDGMYKSTDAGKTWTHQVLRNAQQIPRIAIDPTNAERLFVAALGHPYGPNHERGIYRSTNGGRTYERVDDWGLAPIGDRERRDLLEMIEDRVGRRATLLTSQVPVEHWHECIGDATFGDAILDRLVHHAHRITLTGGSLRKIGVNNADAPTITDKQ